MVSTIAWLPATIESALAARSFTQAHGSTCKSEMINTHDLGGAVSADGSASPSFEPRFAASVSSTDFNMVVNIFLF